MIKFYERPVFLGQHPYLNDTTVPGDLAKEQTTDPTDPAVTGAHYNYYYNGVKVDLYRIFRLYGITDPALQHAIKKLFRLGRDGESTAVQDVQEAISSLRRFIEMEEEDCQTS